MIHELFAVFGATVLWLLVMALIGHFTGICRWSFSVTWNKE